MGERKWDLCDYITDQPSVHKDLLNTRGPDSIMLDKEEGEKLEKNLRKDKLKVSAKLQDT